MGGKLSEGINFNDDLCRVMVVVGLPYPNNQSVEMKQKIRYWDNKGVQSFKGQDFYMNLCLKILNQSIGRCIRHKDDWSYLILLDQRFSNLVPKLPSWVQASTQFYKSHKVSTIENLNDDIECFVK